MLPLSDREKRAAFGILAIFLLSITLPYAYAWAITPQGFTWGGLLFSADDQNVHLMWARQAQNGAFFVRDLFTTENLVSGARPLFFNVLTLAMGWLARTSGLEVAFSYHVVRVAGAAWALWQLHLLSWSVTRGRSEDDALESGRSEDGAPESGRSERENARLWALALAAFSTGAGFLALIVPPILGHVVLFDRADNANWPLMPEAFFNLSALLYPLNIVSLGLLMLVARHILDGKWWPAFLGALLLSNIHTYDALPLIVVAGLWAISQFKADKPSAIRALSALAGALVPVAYQVIVFRDSEEFRIKALTLTLPPHFGNTLLTFAPLLILAVLGWSSLRNHRRERNFLLLWAVVTLALVYTPFEWISFARKMIEGWQIPLVILAGVGISQFKRPIVAGALVAVLAISPLITLNWILANAAENNRSRVNSVLMPALYLYDSEVAAMNFIARDAGAGAVLCLPITGAYVPRATLKSTYLGHWAETLDVATKRPLTFRYFGGQMAPAEARRWFAKNKIRWVFEGPYERSLAPTSPSARLGLTPVFRAGTGENATTVYATGI